MRISDARRLFRPLAGLLVAVCIVSHARGEESIARAIRDLNAKVRVAKPEQCLDLASQYLNLARGDQAPASERIEALTGCVRVVGAATRRNKIEGLSEKGAEAFELYRASLAGASLPDERIFVEAYVRTILRSEVAVNKERLAEFLKIVDSCETALNADANDPAADLARGFLFYTAGSYEDALSAYEKYMAGSKAPSYYAFLERIHCCQRLKRSSDALAVVAEGIKRFESSLWTQVRLARQVPGILAAGDVDEDKAVELLPYCVLDVAASETVLSAVTQCKLRTGKMGQALGYAKLCYVIAPIEKSTAAMELVAKCLAAADMDPAKAAVFLDRQKYGPDGEDGKPGTADDCKDLLSDVGNPLPPAVIAALEARLKTLIPSSSTVYVTLRDRGVICQALGRQMDALRSFRSAYDAASIAQVKEGSALAPRALKALDGSVARANAYLLYQKHGPAGPDGKAGTADDLADPLAGLELPPLPGEVQAALREIAQDPVQSAQGYQRRGFAYLALGEYGKGFDQMRGAYVFAAQGAAQAQAIEGIAAAIKAHDGNVLRANQYLLYQSHGPNGPDKKPGTEDDLVNVFPEVLKEFKKPETGPKG